MVPDAAALDWVIPRPSASDTAMFQNVNRNSLPLLRAAGIKVNSPKHQEFKTTIRVLHHQYLHPFKYLEEQATDRVDQLIAKAQLRLPWLNNYEDSWPARIYLKRYIDGRRPHLLCTRYAHQEQLKIQMHKPESCKVPKVTRNIEDPGNIENDHDSILKELLCSLTPSLEHHLDAFIKLGVKDQKTLQASLSWPQVIQAQFLDEGHGVLQLTSLEKKALLVGCSMHTQRALQESLGHIVKPGYFVHD